MKKVKVNGVGVRSIHFDRSREQVITLARAIGYYDFSDAGSRVFRAQSPDNRHRAHPTNSRNRVTLPDFTDLGDGAWKLYRWFSSECPAGLRLAFFELVGGSSQLFDPALDSSTIARRITEAALGVLVPAEKRGWV